MAHYWKMPSYSSSPISPLRFGRILLQRICFRRSKRKLTKYALSLACIACWVRRYPLCTIDAYATTYVSQVWPWSEKLADLDKLVWFNLHSQLTRSLWIIVLRVWPAISDYLLFVRCHSLGVGARRNSWSISIWRTLRKYLQVQKKPWQIWINDWETSCRAHGVKTLLRRLHYLYLPLRLA